ncbi:pentapeptide repeat-containing protein [Clostridium sp. Marseille-P2415]|uniref:pentapeptide repeat-containing protein n=1 Tax=Clostridium sp. Marseille-P2415 TaxID=1805471 RepID=UPI0009886262|nr:pentapeptide repeat-containing protein [Clostridium sp. Marseille-P2415]
MEREKLLKQFDFGSVLIQGTEKMMELDRFCRENMDPLSKELSRSFERLIERIEEEQRKYPERNIFCISICVLRSRYVKRDGRVKIYAYDEKFYLDSNAIWTEWDAEVLFKYLWELEDNLHQCLRDFKGEVTGADLKNIMLTEYIPYIIRYITEIARFAIRKKYIHKLSKLKVMDDFCITAGEYKGSFDEVYITERLSDNNQELQKLLENYRESNIQFYSKIYENMKLRNFQLIGINFTKSNFYRMDMSDSNFDGGFFLKACFHHCDLKNTSWKEALLFDADFSDSDLSEGDFTNSMASITPPNLFNCNIFSLIGADFTNTNLTNADFTGADFRGADFREAILKNTVFAETRLSGAKFKKEELHHLALTEEQLSGIRIYD